MSDDWTEDIEKVLDRLRMNSVILSIQHKKRYFYLRNILQYFRLPVIIISGINSIVSVGLQPYLNQGTISMMTCLLALACSIIGSIELYLAIQKSMENELMASKDFYLLSIDLDKTLTLTTQHRPKPAKEYLEKKYGEYVKLFENSNLLPKKITDRLNPVSITNLYLNKKNSNNLSSTLSPSINFLQSCDSSDGDSDLPSTPLTNSAVNSVIDEEAMVSLIPQKSLFGNKQTLMSFFPQKSSQDNNQNLLTTITQKVLPSKSPVLSSVTQKLPTLNKETILSNIHIPDKKEFLSNFTQNISIPKKEDLVSSIAESISLPDKKEFISSVAKNISIPDENSVLLEIQENIPTSTIELVKNENNNIERVSDEKTQLTYEIEKLNNINNIDEKQSTEENIMLLSKTITKDVV